MTLVLKAHHVRRVAFDVGWYGSVVVGVSGSSCVDDQQRLTRKTPLRAIRPDSSGQEFSQRTVALQQDSVLHGALSASVAAARARQRGLSFACYLRFLYIGR
ncbi:hypothetical protein [Streptomyces sp. SLBN-134]|uniref:hypothetical protein n=1 Tax=Streptomyces sp. SLBN-134 TaxID=2768456 RepID=UPI001643D567|nr:hypothetical protein [Streptomyces sp. SLBN-134]